MESEQQLVPGKRSWAKIRVPGGDEESCLKGEMDAEMSFTMSCLAFAHTFGTASHSPQPPVQITLNLQYNGMIHIA
eukprot:1140160-Pelagomonas_calceolata.AAC.2